MATGTGQITFIDGTLDFSGGVDSVKVPTVQSESNPRGLARNQLAWLINAGVRDSGILPRTGWQRLGRIHNGSALYQGGMVYDPFTANPYLLILIGGELFKVVPDFADAPVNLSAAFSLVHPGTNPHGYFVQGNKYAVIQAGDNVTAPLFWDDVTLRRSIGINNNAVAPGTPGVNELPAGQAMDYYQGRFWYAQGLSYSAGDIIGGPSGTVANRRVDSILNVTENPLVLGGDGFQVPTNAGSIRALFHNANINAQLGEGQLFIGTRKAIYAQEVPVTRNDWINATDSNAPKQTVVQLINGPVGDRCIVKANGDIFYQTLEPSIASLFAAVRNFGQPGNRSISNNEQRLLAFNDRSLMRDATGTLFNNRLLQAMSPKQTAQGVVHQALVPLDLIPISSFQGALPPNWEGMHEGLDFLQLFTADFGGRERCFATVVSREDSSIELWELTDHRRDDLNLAGEARVTWITEFPAFTWGKEFELKKLVSAELWIDKLFGTAEFTMEWRPDSDPCWKLWKKWKQCSARNSCEDVVNPICYPLETFRESFRATMTLPKPPENCESITGRPAHIGYQMQVRLTIKGWCRLRGLMLHAEPVDRKLYQNLVC